MALGGMQSYIPRIGHHQERGGALEHREEERSRVGEGRGNRISMFHKETQLHHISAITANNTFKTSALSDLQANEDEEVVGKRPLLTVKGGERAGF